MSRGIAKSLPLTLSACALLCMLVGCDAAGVGKSLADSMDGLLADVSSLTQTDREPDFSNMQQVAKLATYQCTYHGVVRIERDPDFSFWIVRLGQKREWYEYDAMVEYGIDATKVKIIDGPDENGQVTVAIPQAEVLNDPSVDSDSISDPISDNDFNAKPTAEEESAALDQANKEMLEKAKSDGQMLANSRQRAKELIGTYVVNVGKEIGKTYTVKWQDAE